MNIRHCDKALVAALFAASLTGFNATNVSAAEYVAVTHSGYECETGSAARTRPDGAVTVNRGESASLCTLRTSNHTPSRDGGQLHNFHPQNLQSVTVFKHDDASAIEEASLCLTRVISGGNLVRCRKGSITGFGALLTKPDWNYFHYDTASIWVHFEDRRREHVSGIAATYQVDFDDWDF